MQLGPLLRARTYIQASLRSYYTLSSGVVLARSPPLQLRFTRSENLGFQTRQFAALSMATKDSVPSNDREAKRARIGEIKVSTGKIVISIFLLVLSFRSFLGYRDTQWHISLRRSTCVLSAEANLFVPGRQYEQGFLHASRILTALTYRYRQDSRS